MIKPVSKKYNSYLISTDKNLMQPEVVHQWLSQNSYWSKNIPFHIVSTAIENSHCIGIFKDDCQVGFGRLITDFATFAYMKDVYVEETHRGQGLGKMMMEVLLGQSWINDLGSIMLGTLDAHKLYEQYGFTALSESWRFMRRSHDIVYSGAGETTAATTQKTPNLGGLEEAI